MAFHVLPPGEKRKSLPSPGRGHLVISRENRYNGGSTRKEVACMPYAYAALWFAIGLILIFSMGKENKVFYFAGGFFLLLGAWWLADALLPEVDLFAGGWGIALKVITGCALAVLAVVFAKEYRKKSREAREKEQQDPAGKE